MARSFNEKNGKEMTSCRVANRYGRQYIEDGYETNELI